MRDQFRRSPSRPAVPAPTMNPDKQHNKSSSAKPFTPSLSKNGYPLTPRLAGAGGYQTPKKLPHSDTASPLLHQEDVVTPAPTYLSANVTPRSGPRNSRRDGAISSPENTPTGAQVSQASRPMIVAGSYHRTEHSPIRGIGKPEPARVARAKSVTSDGIDLRAPSRPNSSCEGAANTSPMFFHADQARSSAPLNETDVRPRSYVKSPQTPTFLYADGTRDQDPQTDDSSRSAPIVKRRSTGSSRVPAAKNNPVLSPGLTLSQPSDRTSRLSGDSSLPLSSDIEDNAEFKSQPPTTPNPVEQAVRPSIRTGRLPSHRKSCSVDSTLQLSSPRGGSRRVSPIISSAFLPPEILNGFPGQTPNLSPRIVSNNSSDQADPNGSPFPLAQSPSKLDSSASHVDEQAINARTERKVLDLEISNSSLLAINRTLERELRKQNAELRSYRRLSRSGRLSMTTSIRSTSGGGLSAVSETDDRVIELSSILSQDEFSDMSDNESSFADEGTLSPDTQASHDARHRANDEKRFLLDIAKHQELLVDSQKMNQSLKRCLTWTEELIKEGKKALEYHVYVSDVDIGGRVLAPDEVGDEVAGARALLSPSTKVPEAFSFDLSDLSEGPPQ